MSLESIKKRLKQYYAVNTDRLLAEKMDMNLNTLKTWSQRGSIPYEKLHLIAQNETISFDWLLTGEGDMYKNAVTTTALTGDEELVQIPEYDTQLSAGHGAYPGEHALEIGFRPFSLQWLKKKCLNASDLKLMRVAGDSMEPLLKDKDMVMIDTSKTTPLESMPFAIRFADDLLVKTIQRQGDGNIALVSRNKDYNDIVINKKHPPEDFQIIGAVVWHAHSWI